jgi:hypothetical protein
MRIIAITKMNGRKKSSPRSAVAKKAAKRVVKKAAVAKERAPSAGKRTSTRDAEREAMTHFISRPYLSPLGKREISSRRITAAIKAVMKAQGSYDFEN